jgi:hypothetical protein
MPKRKIPVKDFLMVAIGCLILTGPLMVLGSILANNGMPLPLSVLLLVSTVVGAVCGALFIRNELRKHRNKQAEVHLKYALRKLGYVALEPIEIHGENDRALIKDEQGSALWNVSLVKNRVVCAKRL